MTYNYLLNIRVRYRIIVFVISFMLTSLILLSFFLEAYSTYSTYAIYNNHNLIVRIPIKNAYIIKNSNNIIINKKSLKYKIINVESNAEELVYNLAINQDDYLDNEIIHITIKYNKEKIFKKIVKYLF